MNVSFYDTAPSILLALLIFSAMWHLKMTS